MVSNIFLYVLLMFLVTFCSSIHMPIGFTVQRFGDQSMLFSTYMEQLGVSDFSNKTTSYNLISLDGYQYGGNYQNSMSPLVIYKNCHRYLLGNKASIYGNSNEEIRKYIITKLHESDKKLLMNVNLKNAPITQKNYDAVRIAEDVIRILETFAQENFDGISIQFEDYHAVSDKIASSWLQKFIITIRKHISNSGFIIVLSIPATFVSKINLFASDLSNALITYFVLQYYGTLDTTYNSYRQIFQSSLSKFRPSAIFEIGKSSQVAMDICRTLVAKPAEPGASWNTGQFMDSRNINNMFQQAYSNQGWFAGFANMVFETDVSQDFANTALQNLKAQCEKSRKCYC